MRQQGYAFAMYARDENDALPYSAELAEGRPGGLTVARRVAEEGGETDDWGGWDGMGLLYRFGYCPAPECFYCPSHAGSDTVEAYDWSRYDPEPRLIQTNYHYSGHIDWDNGQHRRIHRENLVLAVDGLPTYGMVNHDMGMNILRGDGSVSWDESGPQRVTTFLESYRGRTLSEGYRRIWRLIEEPDYGRTR